MATPPDPPSELRPLLEAHSIAVVGASPRDGTFGQQLMAQLVGGGFDGRLYPVNPNQAEVLGFPCFPSIGDLPDTVDLALLAVPNESLEEQLAAAATVGARAAVIYASGHEPPDPGRPPLTERLRRIAVEAGMAVCGPNCMGFVNAERRLRAASYHLPRALEPGPVALVSHSGSAWSAVLHNARGLRLNVAVSSGLDVVTTMSEFVEYALDLETTRAVALFVEAVRDPGRFLAVLEVAAGRGVPVVALKVGRTPRAARMVAAHSGAEAGDDAAFEAVFEANGVLRVRTLDELADTVELLVAGRRARPGGLAAIHDSGGERALLIDAAEEARVPFAELSPETTERIEAVLDPGLPAVNPLDAWGTGNRPHEVFIECMRALVENEDTAALAFCLDLTEDLVPPEAYAVVAKEVFARTEKPVCVLTNMVSAVDRAAADHVRSLGIPVLEGTASGLAAIGHLFDRRDFEPLPPSPTEPARPRVAERWRRRLSEGFDPGADSAQLLGDYGIQTAPPGNHTGAVIHIGMVRDPQFGLMVVIETERGRRFAVPPLDPPRARWALRRLGLPAGDPRAGSDVLAAASRVIFDLGDLLEDVQIIAVVDPSACLVLDAHLEPAG